MSSRETSSDLEIDASNSGATPIGAPIRAGGAELIGWDDECDVLVVGFGAAGACAAIEAANAGASVIVTDRFRGGGASAKSGGVVYAGGGTRFQKTAGYEDSPEAMYEYLCMEVGEAVDRATLRDFCDRSVEMIEWLEAHGVEFDATVPPCKTSYPADGYYLYFSGNETVKEYAGKHPPAPRGHRVKGAGLPSVCQFDRECAASQHGGHARRRILHLLGPAAETSMALGGAAVGFELPQFCSEHRAAFAVDHQTPH